METNGWELRDISPVELLDTVGDDDAVLRAARVSFDKEASGFTEEQNADCSATWPDIGTGHPLLMSMPSSDSLPLSSLLDSSSSIR